MTKRTPEAENSSVRRRHRVREFAELGGVTVKALLHYERVGLLTPTRTPSGHRLYSSRDLDRLRCILALKQLGIPLVHMRNLMNADSATLLTRLAAHRDVLARERERLLRADRAITLVEESLRNTSSDVSGLSRLADVIEMPREAVWMKRYFTDDVWEPAFNVYENWPDQDLVELFREVAAAIPDGPATERAASLLDHWKTIEDSLWRNLARDPDVALKLREGFGRAWMDRHNWPEVLKRRFADYHMDECSAFLGKVSIVMRTRLGSSWSAVRQGGTPHVA